MELTIPPWAASSSHAVTILLATALFFVTMTVLRRRGHRQQQATRERNLLPPGPRPWPVIGNLNLLGALPHRSIHELSLRYGPIMSLRFGAFPAVVGSSVEVAEVLLKTQDLAYLDRPRTAGGKYTAYNNSGIVWSHYGPNWRQLRKLWITELLSARQLRLTQSIRAEEVHAMLRALHPTIMGSKRTVVLKEHLLMVTLNIISRMVLGKKYIGEDAGSAAAAATPEEFRWMIEEIFFLSGALHVGDLVPWLSWFDPHGYVGRMKRLAKMADRFIEHVLREHGDRRRREGDAFVPNDMVDLLLQLADDPSLDVPLDRNTVKATVLELINAATDTSSVTVEWAMSELLRKPDVLGKVTDELDRVVGRDRLVGEGDIPSLPYLEAVVKESMRLHPFVPLLFPRVSREHTTVAGYDVPAGTRVLVNIWAIGRDPAVWGVDAGEFRPERFLPGSKMSKVDVKGQDLELLPFGAGRRMCPANGLALRMIQLVLANLVHGYAWSLPGGMAPEELSMEEKFRLSMSRMHLLQAIPEPRLPDHVYFAP